MAYEEKSRSLKKTHNIIMEDRGKLTVSGVEDVASFDENEVVMSTVCGNLVVRGSELKIDRLSLDTGDVAVQGLITDLCYEEVAPSRSLWARIFH
ncbi:MAG: sporulation protein YabP [Candidatus Heteroscillospira sp.]|jgi:sporulation protein YabP